MLLKTLLKLFGWQKLMLMLWKIAYAELQKLAQKTERTQFDDNLVEFLNQLISTIAGAKDLSNG